MQKSWTHLFRNFMSLCSVTTLWLSNHPTSLHSSGHDSIPCLASHVYESHDFPPLINSVFDKALSRLARPWGENFLLIWCSPEQSLPRWPWPPRQDSDGPVKAGFTAMDLDFLRAMKKTYSITKPFRCHTQAYKNTAHNSSHKPSPR